MIEMGKIKLGTQVIDSVSGFSGVATGRAEYLYENPIIRVQAIKLNIDGSIISDEWFPENQLILKVFNKIKKKSKGDENG